LTTAGLVSSRSASLPIQRGAESFDAASLRATATAAAFSFALRLPIVRSAQLTPFLTKFHSSVLVKSLGRFASG
jgi:hypothetical protein